MQLQKFNQLRWISEDFDLKELLKVRLEPHTTFIEANLVGYWENGFAWELRDVYVPRTFQILLQLMKMIKRLQ